MQKTKIENFPPEWHFSEFLLFYHWRLKPAFARAGNILPSNNANVLKTNAVVLQGPCLRSDAGTYETLRVRAYFMGWFSGLHNYADEGIEKVHGKRPISPVICVHIKLIMVSNTLFDS